MPKPTPVTLSAVFDPGVSRWRRHLAVLLCAIGAFGLAERVCQSGIRWKELPLYRGDEDPAVRRPR